jgi:hypothetical protein
MIISNISILVSFCRRLSKAFAMAASVAGLLLAGAASPAAAQKSPETIRLTPQSKEGAVLLRVDTIPADYQLWFEIGPVGFRIARVCDQRGS